MADGCVVYACNGRLLCARGSSQVTVGPVADNTCSQLSRDAGAELVSSYSDNVVTLTSTLTGEAVSEVVTRTSRYVVGSHTLAYVCVGGVKAVCLSNPHEPAWVRKFDAPCRIVYGDADTIVILKRDRLAFAVEVVDLSSFDWIGSVSSASRIRHVDPPSMFGRVRASRDHIFTFVYNTMNDTHVGRFTLQKNAPVVVTSSPLLSSPLPPGNIMVAASSTVVYSSINDTHFSLVESTTSELESRCVVGVSRGKKTVFVNAEPGAFMALQSDGSCLVAMPSGPLVTVMPSGTAPAPNHLARPQHKKFQDVGRQRRCASCKRLIRGRDAHGVYCFSCTTDGTLSKAFGVAMRYASKRYHYLPDRLAASAMFILFRKSPKCFWTRKAYNEKKLVFVKINEKQPTHVSNFMILRQDCVHMDINFATRRLATRHMAIAIDEAERLRQMAA